MRALTLATLLLAPALAHGAGFQLHERSAAGLGRAFAGEGVIAEDASVLASNPAAMLLLPGDTSVAAGTSGIFTGIDVRGAYTPPGGGTPLPAVANDISDNGYIPYLYLTQRIHERLSLGFGSFTPFGLKTNYPLSFSARSVADHSSIRTVNLNPSAALRINEWWSIGAGFNALYAEGILNATLPDSRPTLDLTGDDWGYGFNLGLLFEIGDSSRVGLHYRSPIDLAIEGRAVSVIPALNGPATLDVTLPDTLTLSGYHGLGERWAIHGELTWVGWSRFDQLAPQVVGAPVQPPVSVENWDDSLRLALGTTWKAGEALTLRAGLAWDESPVDPAFMTLRIPDADRLWLSLGMSYRFHPCWSLDLGYAHVFADTARITDGSPATGVFQGAADGDADLVSIGISGNF